MLWQWRRKTAAEIIPTLLLTVYFGGFILAYFNHELPLPRYLVILIMPLSLLLFTHLPRRMGFWTGVVLIVLQLLNLWGAFYPELKSTTRSGACLERSREYLLDLDANRQLCRWLESNIGNNAIVAQWPFAQMLTAPELRYVSQPLPRVYCPIPVQAYCRGVVSLDDDPSRIPPGACVIYADNDFEFAFCRIRLQPQGQAEIIYRDETLSGDLLLYRLPGSNTNVPAR